MTCKDERVLIVGLGESGRAAARFFARRGARVTATDMRSEAELGSLVEELRAAGVELALGGHPRALFLEQERIVPSPGVPWDLPQLEQARRAGVEVAGELEIAATELKGRVIGVTGTNGKTTTVSLIAHILQGAGVEARAVGNIGTPLLSVVEESSERSWSVVELSSFQLEAMRGFRSHIAVVLNVTPDHLDRHGSFSAYAAAKARIFPPQKNGDFAVLNADDEVCRGYARSVRGEVVWFSRRRSLARGVWGEGGAILRDGARVASAELPIRGPHNLENALAAVAAASLAGVPEGAIAEGLETFRAVEHRLEFVRTVAGADYYNDSKATNVDAALKAVESFDSGLWVILGGRDKDNDFRPLAAPLRERARGALLIGEAAQKIRRQIRGVPIEECGTLAAAVARAHSRARPGDTVLLAPACASFDQFENYGRRGREFKRLVEELE